MSTNRSHFNARPRSCRPEISSHLRLYVSSYVQCRCLHSWSDRLFRSRLENAANYRQRSHVPLRRILLVNGWWDRLKGQIDLIKHFRVLPESVRWLITQKKYEEAKKIILKAAKTNGKTVPPHLLIIPELNNSIPEVITFSNGTAHKLIQRIHYRTAQKF